MSLPARTRLAPLSVAIVLVLSACAPATPGASTSRGVEQARSAAPKRLVLSILAAPPTLVGALNPAAVSIQSGDLINTVVNSGLTMWGSPDPGVRRPVLAEVVPTVENGLWTLASDGRMELVWKVRSDATWHDGAPFNADDLLFTARIAQDPDFRDFAGFVNPLVDSIQAGDSFTVTVRWKSTYILADQQFSSGILPKHVLDAPFQDKRDTFRNLTYWNTEYVGLGPYKVREFTPGTGMFLAANDNYVLGRPRIDEIDVRFITDANTQVANLLSGTVHLTVGTGLDLEQSLQVRDQWPDGHLSVVVDSWVFAVPQFLNPSPTIITDVRFRRALLAGIDRQAIVDTIQSGLGAIAEVPIRPSEPEYREIESSIVRHTYDPRAAMQGLLELGYTRGPEGVLQDATGQKLEVEVRATASPAIHAKTMFPVADSWQRLGLTVNQIVIPVQRALDLEYRVTFPFVEILRYATSASQTGRYLGSVSPVPENRFSGGNRSRYMNAEFDAAVNQYLALVPWGPRMQALGQAMHHMSDQLNYMGLIYDVQPILISNRVENVTTPNPTWNVVQWDLKS